MTQLSNVLITDNSTIKTNYRWSKHLIIVSFLRQIYGLYIYFDRRQKIPIWLYLKHRSLAFRSVMYFHNETYLKGLLLFSLELYGRISQRIKELARLKPALLDAWMTKVTNVQSSYLISTMTSVSMRKPC